jgi:hypothetical protein
MTSAAGRSTVQPCRTAAPVANARDRPADEEHAEPDRVAGVSRLVHRVEERHERVGRRDAGYDVRGG